MDEKAVLIIGKKPLPIGGVTIHVQRVLYLLKTNNIPYRFIDLKDTPKIKILKEFIIADKIHLHTSNVYLRFVLSLLGAVMSKKFDYTLHGDLGRYKSKFANLLDLWSLKLARRPVLLNKKSYAKGVQLNRQSVLGTSFIPPEEDRDQLPEDLKLFLSKIRRGTKRIYCTNAYNLSYDKTGKEIYGIFHLISIFSELSHLGLVISDPSGAYKKIIQEQRCRIPENIFIISRPHSFYKVIEACDGTIRNTSTDGDSISVKESLYLNKLTFCSNVVSRPKGAIIFQQDELKNILKAIETNPFRNNTSFKIEVENSIKLLLELYK